MPSYFSLLFVHKGGGSTWTQPFLSVFPKEFRYETCTISVYTYKDNHKSAKRTFQKAPFQNGGQKNEFSFRENSHVTKIKNHFPKGIFSNKILLKKMNTFTFLKQNLKKKLKMAAKTSFVTLRKKILIRFNRRRKKRNVGSKWSPPYALTC